MVVIPALEVSVRSPMPLTFSFVSVSKFSVP